MAIGRRNFLTGAGLLLAGGVRPALAQSAWPTRPVRFIVPLAAGGAMDFAARQCSVVLSRILGQQVFIENRTGAGGTIGMDTAMKATPDGYTFLFTIDNAAIAPPRSLRGTRSGVIDCHAGALNAPPTPSWAGVRSPARTASSRGARRSPRSTTSRRATRFATRGRAPSSARTRAEACGAGRRKAPRRRRRAISILPG